MHLGDNIVENSFIDLERGKSVTLPKSTSLYESILNYAEGNFRICEVDVRCVGRQIRMVPEGRFIRK